MFGPRVGVHCGNYGNWVPNPAQRLATLLASMKSDDGRVLVKGFYDAVAPLTPEEEALMDAVPEDAADMLNGFGIAAPEKTFPRLQHALQSPTLNVRGLTSAFAAVGDVTEAFRTSPLDPQARALVSALQRTFGEPPVQLRTLGGTVPIAPFFEALGFPAVVVPTVNFDNNQHEENENIRVGTLFDSIATIAAILRM